MPIKIDYQEKFHKTLQHRSNYPVITNVVVTAAGLVTWTTDIPSTSQVVYGTNIYLGLMSPYDSTLVTSHSVQLTGLADGTTYYLKVQSFYLDALSISDLYTFRTVAGLFSGYSTLNVTTTYTFDASNSSLDTLANVVGTLIALFQTGTTVTSSFSISGVTTDRSFNAIDTSLDELSNVIGSLITDLQATGTTANVYTETNVTTTQSFNALDTSLEEQAFVIGSIMATLRGAGIIQ